MLASVPLMLECEAVLTRPEQLDKIGLSAPEINVVLDTLASVIEPVPLHFVWRPRLKDPADEMVLDTAVNGHADRLATFNLRHLRNAAMEFGIRADRPGAILGEFEENEHEKEQRRPAPSDFVAGGSQACR